MSSNALAFATYLDSEFSSDGLGVPPFALHIKSSIILVGISFTP